MRLARRIDYIEEQRGDGALSLRVWHTEGMILIGLEIEKQRACSEGAKKVIACRASLVAGMMGLDCRKLDRDKHRRELRRAWTNVARQLGLKGRGPRQGQVLIQGPSLSVTVPVAVLERMFHDYEIDWSYAITTDPTELQGIDAMAIMLIDHVDVEIHILAYPPVDEQ